MLGFRIHEDVEFLATHAICLLEVFNITSKLLFTFCEYVIVIQVANFQLQSSQNANTC